MVKSIFRIASYLGLVTAYLLLTVVLLSFMISQTDWFKETLRETITSAADESLNGTLQIGSIGGNFVSRLTLNSVALSDSTGDTLVSVKSVSLRYMPLFLLFKSISISDLTISDPVFRLKADSSGQLNFAALLKPSAPDTSQTPGFNPGDWLVSIKSFAVKNGSFSFHTANHREVPSGQLDYGNLDFSEFDLWMSAGYSASRGSFLILKRLTATERISGWRLKDLNFNLDLADDKLKLNYLTLQTDSSLVKVFSEIRFPKPLRLDSTLAGNYFSSRMITEVSLEPFSFYDLEMFLPVVNMLNGSVTGKVRATGNLDTLVAEQIRLNIGNHTVIAAEGELVHLLAGTDLKMNLKVPRSEADYADIHQLLPLYPIPDFSAAGIISFTAAYRGKPLNFTAEAAAETPESGSFGGKVSFDLEGGNQLYDASFFTDQLNLQPVLWNRSEFASALTSAGQISGSGFSLESLSAGGSVKVMTSRWNQIEFESLLLRLDAKEKSVNLNADLLGPFGQISAESRLSGEPGNLQVETVLKGTEINLAGLPGNLPVSKLDFSSESGFEFGDTLFADVDFRFSRVEVDGDVFGAAHQEARLELKPGQMAKLDLAGDWVDASVASEGDPLFWGTQFSEAIRSVASYHPDSLLFGSQPVLPATHDSLTRKLNWKFQIKNIQPVLALVSAGSLALTGKGEGMALVTGKTGSGQFSLNLDSLLLSDQLKIAGLDLSFSLDSVSFPHVIETAAGDLNVYARQLVTAKRNWGQTEMAIRLENGTVEFGAKLSDPDKVLSGELGGNLILFPDSIETNLKTLKVETPAGNWLLPAPSRIGVSTGSLTISDFELLSKTARVGVSGRLSPQGNTLLALSGNASSITDILSPFIKETGLLPSGKLSVKAILSGKLTEPTLSAEAKLQNIRLGNQEYGNLTLNSTYDGKFLSVDGEMGSTGRNPYLMVSGYLPFSLKKTETDNPEEADLTLETNRFDLSLIKGLIPGTAELTGFFNASVHLTGPTDSPELSGSVSLENGTFRHTANNVRYLNIAGSATLKDDLVRITTLDAETENGGRAKLYGSFLLRNYIPREDYNLSLVLNGISVLDKPQTNASNFDGQIELIGVLGLKGNYTNSSLRGNLRIKKASLNIVAASANVQATNEDSFISFTSESGKKQEASRSDSAIRLTVPASRKKKENGFSAGLTSFVQIDASQNANLSVVLNKATGERLITELNGNLNMQYQQQNLLTTGVLNVQTGKYNFYTTQFDVDQGGKISFTGNLLEPEVDLVARTTITRQVADTNISEVNVISLGIKGGIFEPQLTYDIASNRNGVVRSTADNPDMKDKAAANIISLILVGQWLYDPYLEGVSTAQFNLGNDLTSTTINAGFGVLSNHIGRFLSGVDNQIRYVNFQVHNTGGKTENIGGVFVYDIAENWSLTGGLNYNLSDQRTTLTGKDNTSRLGLSWRLENKLTQNLSWDIFQTYDPYAFDTRDQIIRGVSLFYRTSFYRWGELVKKEDELTNEIKKSEKQSQNGNPPVSGK